MMRTAWLRGFVSEEQCGVLSLEQAHSGQLGHGYELCPGAKSVAGSGLSVWSLTWAGSGQFHWDPKH